jgi:hypothetical protein
MLVEQETTSLIIFGFTFVIVIVAISIFVLWEKTKNRGLLWFIPQLIMQGICLLLFLKLIHNQNSVPAVMLSEENSLTIGLMGISWALSMIFMAVGVIVAVRNKTS